MFEWLKAFLWKIKRVLMSSSVIEREFHVSPVTSRQMEQNINLWYAMYTNTPPWETCDVQSVGLPGAIAREFTRSALTEFSVTVSGSQRADYINEQIQRAVAIAIPNALELGLALGGVALKPVVSGDKLIIDFTTPAAFTPTEFDEEGQAIGGVFCSKPEKVGGKSYVRMEYHSFKHNEDGSRIYLICNAAYVCGNDGTPTGERVDLSVVPKWAMLPAELSIANLEHPLFAYFKRPTENNIDFGSDVGTSVYSGAAVGLIRQADEQWGRLMWEYESGERKIFADGTATNANHFKSRLFEYGSYNNDGDFFQVFNPEMRDDPLYNGFQRILQRIEFETGLAFGDISDPQSVERTATEIRSSKHRKYVTVDSIQKAFQNTLDRLVYAMNALCDIYRFLPAGGYEVSYNWGDSVLDDPDSIRQDKSLDLQEVAAGIRNDWEYRMKWFKESEEDAKRMLPGMETLTDEPQNEIE